MFLKITSGTNHSKILTKNISSKGECRSDGWKSNLNQKWDNHKCRCECKNPKEYNLCQRDYILNPATCSCGNGKNLWSIINTFGDYMWWNYRNDKKHFNKKCLNKNFYRKNYFNKSLYFTNFLINDQIIFFICQY